MIEFKMFKNGLCHNAFGYTDCVEWEDPIDAFWYTVGRVTNDGTVKHETKTGIENVQWLLRRRMPFTIHCRSNFIYHVSNGTYFELVQFTIRITNPRDAMLFKLCRL